MGAMWAHDARRALSHGAVGVTQVAFGEGCLSHRARMCDGQVQGRLRAHSMGRDVRDGGRLGPLGSRTAWRYRNSVCTQVCGWAGM